MRITPLSKDLNRVKALHQSQNPALTSLLNFDLPRREVIDARLKSELITFKKPHYSEFGNNSRRDVLLALGLLIASLSGLILGLYLLSIGV